MAMYEGCPQQFLWTKGWGNLEVGGGPGRSKPKPVKKSEHHAVMGTAIQAVIERFYNDELWKLLDPQTLRDRMLEMADSNLKAELARRFIDYRMSPPMEELRQVVRDGVLGYMRTLKAHMLLGPYSKAEVELLGFVDKHNPVGGRADMIIRRDDTGVTILDGKNGKRYSDGKGGTMTYTDPDQLRWYAMLFYLCYQQMPNRLGFVYYRYPHGTPILDADGQPTGSVESGVDWVPFTKDDIKGLAQRAVDNRKAMDKERFVATPSYKQCKFCEYESVCPERLAQKETNRRTPKEKPGGLKLEEYSVFSFGGPVTPEPDASKKE